MSNGRILKFERDKDTLLEIAERRADEGDPVGSLGLLFSALEKETSPEVLTDIADVYADMGLYDYSNRFWYKYLDVAPKNKRSIAYEELGINYFYSDNYWAAGYFFQKKVEADGYINRDGLEGDILEFLSNNFPPKPIFKIVYPEGHADYSEDIKRAKSALVSGNYYIASSIYREIPLKEMTEDECGDAQTAYYLSEEDDLAIEACKFSLSFHGENVTAYCNLSTIYKMKNDDEKSAYYYKKALESRKGEPTEYYKIATCAVEQDDNAIASECFKFILTERPYEVELRYFRGLSLLNLGKYEEAVDEFSFVLRIVPTAPFPKYYLGLAKKIRDGDANSLKLLPVKFARELPKKVARANKKRLIAVADDPLSVKSFFSKKENRDVATYGLFSCDSETARLAAYALSLSDSEFAKKTISDALLIPELPTDLKRYMIYILILNGKKDSFGAVGGNIYEKIKPKKLVFSDKPDGIIYVSAYANTLSRLAFIGLKDQEKLAFYANKTYKTLGISVIEEGFSPEEIAALITLLCEYKGVSEMRAVTRIFGVKKERVLKLKELYDLKCGEKNDKND